MFLCFAKLQIFSLVYFYTLCLLTWLLSVPDLSLKGLTVVGSRLTFPIKMDDLTILITIFAGCIIFLGIIWLFNAVANNNTRRFISSQTSNQEITIARLKQEGELVKIGAKERIVSAQCKSNENIKEMEMHGAQGEINVQREKIAADLRLGEIQEEGRSNRAKMALQLSAEFGKLEYNYKNAQLECEKTLTFASIESQDRWNLQQSHIENAKLEYGRGNALLQAETTVKLANIDSANLTLQENGLNHRLNRICDTQQQLAKENTAVQRHRTNAAETVSLRAISAQENSHRITEVQKTMRSGQKYEAKKFAAIADTAGKLLPMMSGSGMLSQRAGAAGALLGALGNSNGGSLPLTLSPISNTLTPLRSGGVGEDTIEHIFSGSGNLFSDLGNQ